MANSSSSDDDMPIRPSANRTAKKSTGSSFNNSSNSSASARPVTPRGYPTRVSNKTMSAQANRFLSNFNPEMSAREKRKLNRKINPPSNVKRPLGAQYDESGIHIQTYVDLCDCLSEECTGCWFPCPKCGSPKCGIECRVHRKFLYDQKEYHGYDTITKNPLIK